MRKLFLRFLLIKIHFCGVLLVLNQLLVLFVFIVFFLKLFLFFFLFL